jgi:alkyl hydroperoxide reductase subunit F
MHGDGDTEVDDRHVAIHPRLERSPRRRQQIPAWLAVRGEARLPRLRAFKQIIIATGDGPKAALGAFDHLIRTTAPAA